jgi:hypothetical protein
LSVARVSLEPTLAIGAWTSYLSQGLD